MTAVTLPPLGDLSQYIDPDNPNPIKIHNTALLSVKDRLIECSGLILSVRSTVFRDMLLNDNEIFLTEFEDEIENVNLCLKLLYGGSVVLTERNVFVIYKFGVIYMIESLQNLVLDWLLENLQLASFWGLFITFQRYGSETLLNVFHTVCNTNIMENSPSEFVKITVNALRNCEEIKDQKYITQFMFNTKFDYLEECFKVFQMFFTRDVVALVDNTKEEIADLFLDCIDSKLGVIEEQYFDSQLLYQIFESLQDVMSTKANFKKLASVQLKVLSRLPANSGGMVQDNKESGNEEQGFNEVPLSERGSMDIWVDTSCLGSIRDKIGEIQNDFHVLIDVKEDEVEDGETKIVLIGGKDAVLYSRDYIYDIVDTDIGSRY